MTASLVVRSPSGSKSVQVESGLSIQEYILAYDSEMRRNSGYGGDSLFCGIKTDIYINDCCSSIDIDRILDVLNPGDVLHINHRPQGFDPITIAIAAVVAAVAIVALIPKPEIPQVNGRDLGGVTESPNNRLSGQTNIARPYQEIPEIFGEIRSYPDLIQPSLFEYVNNIKFVREIFCIGVGEYSFGTIRDGDTPISSVQGASARIFGPGTTPPDLQIGRESNDIDGQELQAADDANREYRGRIVFINRSPTAVASTIVFNSSGYITSTTLNLAWLLDLSVGDVFSVSGSSSNPGPFSISSISLDQSGGVDKIRITVSESVVSESVSSASIVPSITPQSAIYAFDGSIVANQQLDEEGEFQVSETSSNNGVFTINSSETVDVQTSITSSISEVTRFMVAQSFTTEDDPEGVITKTGTPAVPWVGWFQLTGEMDQIWTHYQAPQGLQSEEGNAISVQLEIQTEQTQQDGTPMGGPVSTLITLRSGSLDPIFQTTKIIVPSKGFYRIRTRRVTNSFSGNAIDLVKWEEVFAVENYTSSFGDVTLLDVTTRATNFALNSSRRQINADVTRRLGTARSGSFVETLSETKSFADAVVYTLMKAGRDISEINIDDLYGIEQELSSELSEFNFSFDDENIDLGSRIITICNAARVSSYRDGQVWRFVRDQAMPNRTLTFNRRNIASGENQHQSYMFRRPNDFDSVALRYTDPDTNRRAEVNIMIDAGAGQFVEGVVGVKPSRIDLAGCRNETQARDRAHLEVRKLLYQRRRVTDIVLNDGNLVDLGDRVSWVDIYDGDVFDGEILSVDGDNYRTSERFEPESGQSYVVTITDSSGNTTAPVAAIPNGAFGFTASISGDPIISNGTSIQAGSKYLIGNVNDVADSDFTVVSKQPQNSGRVRVEMINYTDELYEMDGNLP